MVQTIQAKIVSVTQLNDTIWQYTLKPMSFIPYQAGQYLQIHKSEGDHYYSIANAPGTEQVYELHVRHRAPSPLQIGPAQTELSLSLPYGKCDVSHFHPDKPILFLAFGTGFAPIRAMIQQLIAQADPRHFELHWSVAVVDDLYDVTSLQQWQSHPSFQYFSHISSTNQSDLIPEMLARYPDLTHWQIVMGGPFDLMFDMQKKLLQHGLQKESIFSDAFDFSA